MVSSFYKYFYFLIIVLVFSSCKKDQPKKRENPVNLKVMFSAEKTVLTQGEEISFADSTEGYPLKWQWYFEGGVPATSTSQHPSGIRYDNLGEYSVKLVVSNAYGDDSLVKKRYIQVKGVLPVVTTATPYEIETTSAIGGGEVEEAGSAEVEEVGVVWSLLKDPTVDDNKLSKPMTGLGDFSFTMVNLLDNTTYYYRAYAKTEDGIGYGSQREFTTLEIDSCDFIDERFVDPRDGKSYRYTDIGGVRWMGDNLNYSTANSWCYDDDEANCDRDGRLYTFESAQNACPDGWRLPTKKEWDDMVVEIGVNPGNKMKKKNVWGYITPASNDFCFSATPSGYKNLSNNTYTTRGFFAYWWTSTSNKDEVLSKGISYDNAAVIEKAFVGEDALSVRCIKK